MNVTRIVLGNCNTNTYVVINNGEAIIIDPASDAQFILDYIERQNARIEYVLITHGHFDHIGAVYDLQQSGAKVYMSKADYDLIKFGESYSVFGANNEPFVLDTAVADGDEFMLLGYKFKVVSTPGHTPGSVCYIMDDLIMFSGDTIFKRNIGRTDFEFGSFAEIKDSLKKLVALSGDYSILPGHGESTTLDFERKNNPYVD